MSRAFTDYLVALSAAVAHRDGEALKTLLSVRNTHALHAIQQRAQSQPGWSPAAAARAQLRQLAGTPWEEAFPAHVATLAALAAGRPGDAYAQLIASVQPFIKAFREDQEAWLVGPMHVCVNNLREVAVAADAEARAAGRPREALENCGTQLQKCFSAALQGQGAARGARPGS